VAISDASPIGRAVLGEAQQRFLVETILLPTPQMLERFRRGTPQPPWWRKLLSNFERRATQRRAPTPEPVVGERLSWDEITERWGAGAFDLFLAAGFPAIFPDRVLQVGQRAVNVHTSLLPQLKGRNPQEWAVAWGLPRSGLTAHEMTSNLDSGPIVAQTIVPIPAGTTPAAHYRDLIATVPAIMDQLERWIATGERALPVDVPESWSPGEPPIAPLLTSLLRRFRPRV
jgi:folate-dependent phosphoribosylglycinamide formyltransferase PurN